MLNSMVTTSKLDLEGVATDIFRGRACLNLGVHKTVPRHASTFLQTFQISDLSNHIGAFGTSILTYWYPNAFCHLLPVPFTSLHQEIHQRSESKELGIGCTGRRVVPCLDINFKIL